MHLEDGHVPVDTVFVGHEEVRVERRPACHQQLASSDLQLTFVVWTCIHRSSRQSAQRKCSRCS